MFVSCRLTGPLQGVELVLYHKTMRIFLGRIRKRHESDVFFAAFSTVMFILATGWTVIDAVIGEDIWLLDRNYPGGPVAYLSGPPSDWSNRVRTVVVIILQQMTDGLMVGPTSSGLMQPVDVEPSICSRFTVVESCGTVVV